MKTMEYDGRKFWQIRDGFAMRPKSTDRMEFLDWSNGEITLKNRTVEPWLNEKVRRMFVEEGIA